MPKSGHARRRMAKREQQQEEDSEPECEEEEQEEEQEVVSTKQQQQKQGAQNKNKSNDIKKRQQIIEQMRAAGTLVLPDAAEIEAARKVQQQQQPQQDLDSKKKPTKNSQTPTSQLAVSQPVTQHLQVEIVSSDEEVPNEEQQRKQFIRPVRTKLDEWELMAEMEEQRLAIIARNENRAQRRAAQLAAIKPKPKIIRRVIKRIPKPTEVEWQSAPAAQNDDDDYDSYYAEERRRRQEDEQENWCRPASAATTTELMSLSHMTREQLERSLAAAWALIDRRAEEMAQLRSDNERLRARLASSRSRSQHQNKAAAHEIARAQQQPLQQQEQQQEQHPPEVQASNSQPATGSNSKDKPVARSVIRSEATATADVASSSASPDFRVPICCVLGHVNAGKTSLLHRIRRSNNAQDNHHATTQHIGATLVPFDTLSKATNELNSSKYHYGLQLPGLLFLDTPGHESFANLRRIGSSVCDGAVVVVDIMLGVQQQTRESIKLLRDRKCPFIIALNKIDQCVGWEPHENMDIESTLAKQKAHTRQEFDTRVAQVLSELRDATGYNAKLYWHNEDIRKNISVLPISTHTGEGIADLIVICLLLSRRSLERKAAVSSNGDFQCTVLDGKVAGGIGIVSDVCLINGTLNVGDKLVLCGRKGPIETVVRALLKPEPMHELRTNCHGACVIVPSVGGTTCVTVFAANLDEVVPGTPLFVYTTGDERLKAHHEVATHGYFSTLSQIDKKGIGVTVQASSLGAIIAIMSFLKDNYVAVGSVGLGPLHKKHLQHALAMQTLAPGCEVVLVLGVRIADDAKQFAATNEISIFEAAKIDVLFAKFNKGLSEVEDDDDDEEDDDVGDDDDATAEQPPTVTDTKSSDHHQGIVIDQESDADEDPDDVIAIYPVVVENLKSVSDSPMVLSGAITRGTLHIGTPLCCLIENATKKLPIGRVNSIQVDGKDVETASSGTQIAFKLVPANDSLRFGQQFGGKTALMSNLTSRSVEKIETQIRLPPRDWKLLKELKRNYGPSHFGYGPSHFCSTN